MPNDSKFDDQKATSRNEQSTAETNETAAEATRELCSNCPQSRCCCSHLNRPTTRPTDRQPAAAATTASAVLATEPAEEDCTWATGEQARCNCTGRRRSTLAGLIELFEQKVKLDVDSEELNLARRARSRAGAKQHGKVNKQASDKMRNIITPVDYDDRQHPDEEARRTEHHIAKGDSSVGRHSETERRTRRRALDQAAIKGVPVLPQPDLKTLTNPNWRSASDERVYLSKNCCRFAGRGLASRTGSSIVKHQASSSRRLLSQLARLRRLNEPNYLVKRPEKVAQVEELIDELERATVGWDEDEHLLDRAESRDWPAEYQRRYCGQSELRHSSNSRKKLSEEADFGLRSDVNPAEEAAIERSHSHLFGNHMELQAPGSSWSAQSTLSRPPRRPRQSIYADRYLDDLAVRRLGGLSPVSAASEPPTLRHQMSYLLCSNAYTPSIESEAHEWDLQEDDRARNDDLHYRSLSARSRLAPHEPPFGIPRQASGQSSASHYLRRLERTDSRHSVASNSPSLAYNSKNIEKISKQTQVDLDHCSGLNCEGRNSRVSFKVDQNRASADSGRPFSAAESRSTPNSDLLVSSIDPDMPDFDEELLLDSEQMELERILGQSATNSPTLERHTASIKVAPSRRRPKINIENPRSKSSLLSRPEPSLSQADSSAVRIQCYGDKRPKSELECHYDFGIEESEPELDEFVIRSSSRSSGLISTEKRQTDRRLSSEPNDSSIERLDYRGNSSWLEQTAQVTVREPKNKSVAFSIGQYKSLNKPNLKIL